MKHIKFLPVLKTYSLIILLLIQFLFFSSCEINEPTIPNWDLNLSLPLFDTTYTLMDIIEKDSTNLKPDYTQQGLIIYSSREKIESLETKDKLNVDDFSKRASEVIGSIKIDNDSSKAEVGFDWLQQSLPPGQSSSVLPEFDNNVNSNLESLENFELLKVESGTIKIRIFNHFTEQVTFVINGLVLRNVSNNDVVLQTNAQIEVPPNSFTEFPDLTFNSNTIVSNQLKVETIVSSTGSNGNIIQIPLKTFTVYVTIKDLLVTEARAKIPNQDPVIIDSSLIIDENSPQPTKFKNIKIERGVLDISLTNNLDVDANVSLEVFNLKNPSNSIFTINKLVSRKSVTKFVDNLSLSDYSLVSLNNLPDNQVFYKFTFNIIPSNDYRTIKNSDSFEAYVEFNSLKIKEFDGIIKPTSLDETRSSIKLDSENIQNKFSFAQINFNKPIIELRIKSSEAAKFNFKLTGRIEAKSLNRQSNILNFNENTLNKIVITENDSIVRLNSDSLSNFFKKFSNLPDSLIFTVGGILNTQYQEIIINNNTTIKGDAVIEFPLNVGISDAIYTDTLKLDFSDDTKENIRNLNTGELNFSITNGLPVTISFTGKLYDNSDRFLMYFPPKQSNLDTVISVSGSETDENGVVVFKTLNNIKIKMTREEADLLSQAKCMKIVGRLHTSRANNLPVKFRVYDDIKLNSFGTINYHIKP